MRVEVNATLRPLCYREEPQVPNAQFFSVPPINFCQYVKEDRPDSLNI
jgi:hypothetical protein